VAKRSVLTRTVTGSNLDHGRLLSLGRQPVRAWQKPTGAQFEILPIPNTGVYQKPAVPFLTIEKTTQWTKCTVATVTAVTPTIPNDHGYRVL